MTESPLTLGTDALCELASEVSYQPEIRGNEDVQRDMAGYLRHTDHSHRDHQLKLIVEAYVETNATDDYNRQSHWLGEAKRLATVAVIYDLAAAAMAGSAEREAAVTARALTRVAADPEAFEECVQQNLAIVNSSNEPVVLRSVPVHA